MNKKYTKNMLTEGKHWPEDYEKTAFNLIKQSAIGQQSWYTDDYISQDVKTFINEFTPLSHKSSNLGFFMAVIRWFIEYSGTSAEKYKEFIERKLDTVIAGLLKIRNDKAYDADAEKIKKMSFNDFMKLVDEVNAKTSATTDVKASDAKFKVVPIYSYEELHKKYGGNKTGYKGDSEWCHTNGKSTYDSWTKEGTQMFFVVEREGWQKIKAPAKKPKNCYDQYGMSLIAILVDVRTNKLLNSTSRWNHVVLPASGASDTMFESWEQLNKAVGMNVEKTCRDECGEMKEKLDSIAKNANEDVARILRTVDVIEKDTLPDEVRKAVTNVVVPDNITRIGDYAFYNCTSLTSITIPDGVQTIGEGAFEGCTSLQSVTIPDSVQAISSHAFYNCTSLTSVTIPDSVQEIGGYAFYNCTSLTSVTIPDGVQEIGGYAFYNCTSLTSITILDGVQTIGSQAFSDCTSLKSVTIPDSVQTISYAAFSYCISLASVTIGNSVQEIDDYAFYNCTSLTSVTIPDGVQTIGSQAFSDCTSLSSVTIPDSVQTISYAAFFGCNKLSSVTIPDSVQKIGAVAFSHCTSLKSVTIPDGVQTIGSEVFSYCTGLQSVTIPDGVQTIGKGAFSECTSLASMTFKGNALQRIKRMENYPWGIRDKSIIRGDESVNKKTRRTSKQIQEAIAYWKNALNEGLFGYTIDDLRGKPYEAFAKRKNPPSYEKWEAAQLPDPEEDEHGKLASAEILEVPGERDYLKKYQVHGVYPDGTQFSVGPCSRKVCSEYISLHQLSKNSRAYARMRDSGFEGIKTIDEKPEDSKLPQVYDIVKMPRGFYLKLIRGSTKVGPFDNRQLARMYATANDIELQKSGKTDRVAEVLHIAYPTWLFTYKMRGVECADIVVAEDESSAMKLFDFQWRVFDNTRPVKSKFNSIEELRRDLSLLKITDINMEKLDEFNAEELLEAAEDIGNPSEKPELMKFCRNPRFRYILGIDMKTGRCPVKILW